MRFKIQLKGHSGENLIDLFLSLSFYHTDGKVPTKINELYFKVGVKGSREWEGRTARSLSC